MGKYWHIARNKAHNTLSVSEVCENLKLLVRFNDFLKEVNMGRSLEELEENEGYRDFSDNLNHLLKHTHIQVLEAIVQNDLATLQHLYKKGITVECYKAVNIRLAITYGHIDVMRFLIQTKQINSDISEAIGELASPKTFDNIMQSLHPSFTNTSPYSVPEVCGHLTLQEWYQSLSDICVSTIYEATKRTRNYGIRNGLPLNIALMQHLEKEYSEYIQNTT